MKTLLDLFYEIAYQIIKKIIISSNLFYKIVVFGSIVIVILSILYVAYQITMKKESHSFCNSFWLIMILTFMPIGAIAYWIFEKLFCSKGKKRVCEFKYIKWYLLPIVLGFCVEIVLGYIPNNNISILESDNSIITISTFVIIFTFVALLFVEIILLLINATMKHIAPFEYKEKQDEREYREQVINDVKFYKNRKQNKSENKLINFISKEDFNNMILIGVENTNRFSDATYYWHGRRVRVCFLESDIRSITMSFFSTVVLMMGVVFPTICYYVFIIK